MKDILIMDGGTAGAAMAAMLIAKGVNVRTNIVKLPTLEQQAKRAADRERAEWNRAVEAKKAAKKLKKDQSK